MAAVARAVTNGWVSWAAYNIGLLSFDHSTFDGSDVFGVSPLDASFGGTYDDVSAKIAGVHVTRGRSNNLDVVLAGSASVDLRDPDGLFNPDNAGAIRNLCTNPSFETNLTGWSRIWGVETLSRSMANQEFGAAALSVGIDGAHGSEGVFYDTGNSLSPGLTYTFSCWILNLGGGAINLLLRELTSGGATVGSDSVSATTVAASGVWTRLSVTRTFGATGVLARCFVTNPALEVKTFYIDGAQLEPAAAATTYCDGDQDNCRWSGVAHASTSIYGGPLYGQLEDRLHPVKLVDTFAGTSYGLFYGWVRRFHWEPQGRRGITRLECVDLFYWLERANPVIASTGATTTGTAIGKILDAVGATDIAMRDLDAGDSIPDFSADGTQTGLQLIQRLLEAERGVFFIAGSGKATYRSRTARLTKTSSTTITDKMSGAAPGVDWDQAYTRITVQRIDATGAVTYTATAFDSAVVAKVGYNDMPAIQTPYLSSNAQADALASWILSQNVSPKPPMRDFTLDNREAAQLTQILARELVDRITVNAARGGTSGAHHVDSLDLTIDGASGAHTVNWLLSKASPVMPIQFDTAQFDAGYQFVY